MFSGGDSSEGVNNLNQLGACGFVNQVAVSNAVAAGQNIDWAQLAQQWIQMRDNNSSIVAEANPNPSSSNLKFEEKGESDMDMDEEEQADEKSTATTQRLSNDFVPCSSMHTSLNQQPWFFGEGTTSQLEPQTTGNVNQWNPWSNREVLPHPLPSQNSIGNRPVNPTAHIPSLLKINVPHPNEIRVMPDVPNQMENIMDAAKRKGLPAWIREGLEKMEREKQKQLEKEQQKRNYSNSSDEDDISNKNIVTKSLNFSNGIAEPIFDEESSCNEDKTTREDFNFKRDDEEDDDAVSSSEAKTYEQKLADLMIVVRRTLTELLLEATNEEISQVAEQSTKAFKSKASSAQVIRKSALSTLTGKLGLAAYGDSSSEDNSDDEHNSSKSATGQSESENDSEEEIMNAIRSKRRTFIKTSEEIEERVAIATAREEEKLKYFLRKEEEEEREKHRKKQERSSLKEPSSSTHSGHSNFKGYEKQFGEISETKIQQSNGKRQRDRSSRKERTTRFSDNKDKYVAIPNAATFLTNMNSAANTATVNATVSSTISSNSQRQNLPDINGLLPNYANAGMTNVLNAADAALEKALKGKISANTEKESRQNDRDRNYASSKKRQRTSDSKKSKSRSNSSSSSTSSSSSSSSSDSDSSSSTSRSHHSKYNHRSSKKHKSNHDSSGKQYEKSHRDHKSGDRKYSSSLYRKRGNESSNSRYRRNGSSDSEDEYRRRHKYDSHYSRNSSHSHSYTSSKRDREHSRSQSRSSYSSSSNRRK